MISSQGALTTDHSGAVVEKIAVEIADGETSLLLIANFPLVEMKEQILCSTWNKFVSLVPLAQRLLTHLYLSTNNIGWC